MGLFVNIFQWVTVLYVKNVTMHAYCQHEWRDAGGRGLAIPSGYLGTDSHSFWRFGMSISPLGLAIWL